MARMKDVVVDCAHPASLARFWAAVLDGYAVAPYDDDELARLRAMGIDDPEDDPGVIVEGPGLRMYFQKVAEAKVAKNRVHLDLTCANLEVECERLLALGATRLAQQPSPENGSWVALADPEGNELCIARADA